MNEFQLRELLQHLDGALHIYESPAQRFSAVDLSVKSMLGTLRAQVALQLSHGADLGTRTPFSRTQTDTQTTTQTAVLDGQNVSQDLGDSRKQTPLNPL